MGSVTLVLWKRHRIKGGHTYSRQSRSNNQRKENEMSEPVTLQEGNLATAVRIVREKLKGEHEKGTISNEDYPVALALVDMVATAIRKAGNIDDQLTRIANVLEKIEGKMK